MTRATWSSAPRRARSPSTMEEFLTAVTTDVDAYWTKVFADSEPAGAEGHLLVDPGRPDRGERLRRRGRRPGRLRRRVLLGRRHDLHLAEVRDRHLRRRARSRAARQLAGLRADGRRLRGRLHRRARVRPSGPGRARPVRALRAASSRRWRSSCRPTATPARGPTAPTRRTVSRRATCRRRWTRRSPSATSTPATRAITGRPSSARKPGTAASSPAIRRRAAATWTRPRRA